MPAVLNIKPETIDTNEKRSKYTVGIVGCRQKGILYATAFAEEGFKVICTDADQSLVKKLAKGKSPYFEQEKENQLKNHVNSQQITTTNELKQAVTQSDIIILTINVKVNDKKTTTYSELETICKQVGAALHQGALVIYVGIGGLGSLDGIIRETLENTSGFKVGRDFGLAYNPFHISKTHPVKSQTNMDLMVAASEKNSLESASTILNTISKNIKQVNDAKIAELAAILNAVKQDVNTALANELAVLCENAGIDFFKVLNYLDANGSNCYPTIEEEENNSEAYLLLESAENLNVKLRIPALARQINEDMVKHAVNLTQDALRNCGKTLRRARVAVLGTASPQTATSVFIKMITLKGAKASLYDPLFPKNEVSDSTMLKRSLNEAVEGTDCIVILTDQNQFQRLNLKKLRAIMKTPAVLVDLIGLIEPQRVETEGFIYRGLGRGKG
jgi:UDP-N-acetyl-D-mannosaminuronic acid dehydrogenase